MFCVIHRPKPQKFCGKSWEGFTLCSPTNFFLSTFSTGDFPLFHKIKEHAPQFTPHVMHYASPDLAQVSPALPQPYPHGLKRIMYFHLAAGLSKP
jgi:hypothetical protein